MVNLFFLQVKFRSFLEILETFEKTVFLTVFKITVIKTNNCKISKNDRNLTCKKNKLTIFYLPDSIKLFSIFYLWRILCKLGLKNDF